jgi:hypothetical protein
MGERAVFDRLYFLSVLISWSLLNAFLLWNLITDPSGTCPPEAMCFLPGATGLGFGVYVLGYPIVAICLAPGFALASRVMRGSSHLQSLFWIPAWMTIAALSLWLLALVLLPFQTTWEVAVIGAVLGLPCGIAYWLLLFLHDRSQHARLKL